MKAICKTRCFYGGREWLPGEAVIVGAGEIPAHFRAAIEDEPDKGVKSIATTKAPQPETAHSRAQGGEAVALSQLNGSIRPEDDVNSLL